MSGYKFGTWYSIDTLKDIGIEVLFYNYMGISIGEANIHGEFWCDNGIYEPGFEPTHWMPLPPEPKEV